MRWRAALLMASPSAAAGEAPPALSACFTAIQNRPPASAMMIAAPTTAQDAVGSSTSRSWSTLLPLVRLSRTLGRSREVCGCLLVGTSLGLGSSCFGKNAKRSGGPTLRIPAKTLPPALRLVRQPRRNRREWKFASRRALPDTGNGPKEKVNDESFGSMEAESAIRALLHVAGVAGTGRVHVRRVGLGRAAGRLRPQRRPVAAAARERRRHVLALPAAVRELGPGPAQWPGGGRGGEPGLAAAQVRRDLVHRPDRGRQGSAHGRARGRDHLEGRFPDGAGRRGRLPHGAAADPVSSAVDGRPGSASGRAGDRAG